MGKVSVLKIPESRRVLRKLHSHYLQVFMLHFFLLHLSKQISVFHFKVITLWIHLAFLHQFTHKKLSLSHTHTHSLSLFLCFLFLIFSCLYVPLNLFNFQISIAFNVILLFIKFFIILDRFKLILIYSKLCRILNNWRLHTLHKFFTYSSTIYTESKWRVTMCKKFYEIFTNSSHIFFCVMGS